MEISIKSFILIGSVVLTGLSAGLFYAWSVSVIPGTQKVTDPTYLETMQSINQAILNPGFFIVFFGSLLFLSISSIYELYNNNLTLWLFLIVCIIYLIGTIAVTGRGNVLLNDQLEALDLVNLDIIKMGEFRNFYQSNWNRLHLFRTVCAVLSFIISLLATLTNKELY